ncbi:MAG: hypothetical protein LBV79_12475 [Candidatus Adiutrix sp.]|nr:hypothetical protein [Candidatus Adiutrix sp.]
MISIQALAILLLIFAFGEVVADKTRAVLSTTLVIAVVLLLMFWGGLPADIFNTAAVTGIAMALIGPLITSIGSLIDLAELKRQWKTVVIGFICVVCAVALIIVVCPLMMDRNMALSGSAIFAGANVAALIMTQALEAKQLHEVGAFVILMLVTQNFIGIPVASHLLRKEAQNFLKTPENVTLYAAAAAAATPEAAASSKGRKLLELPPVFQKPSMELAKLAIGACLASYLSGLTNGVIHYFVVALLVGILLTELGFLQKQSLNKSASAGFIIFATTMIIFTNLAKTTPQMMLGLLLPLVICLGVGVIGVLISGAIIGKILNVSPYLAITLGLTCTFGFPTTMLMSQEVANAIGRDAKEKSAIESYLLPKMVTAGMVTVTIVSVLVAGAVAKML